MLGSFSASYFLFVSALLGHWLDFLKGSGVVVALGLFERFILKREVHVRWYAIFLVVLAFFACFQAWQDEHTSAEGRLLETVRLQEQVKAQTGDINSLKSERNRENNNKSSAHIAVQSAPGIFAEINSRLTTFGSLLDLVGNTRSIVHRYSPITFRITGTQDAQASVAVSDISGVIALVCQLPQPRPGTTSLDTCFLDSTIGSMAKQSGISISAYEESKPSPASSPLLDAVYQTLHDRFQIHRVETPSDVMDKISKQHVGSRVVWLDVGPGSPWVSDDIRLKDGVPKKVIDDLMGYDIASKDALSALVADMRKAFDDQIRNAAPYSLPGGTGHQAMLSGINSVIMAQYVARFKDRAIKLMVRMKNSDGIEYPSGEPLWRIRT